jgi:hypothetical protein
MIYDRSSVGDPGGRMIGRGLTAVFEAMRAVADELSWNGASCSDTSAFAKFVLL